VLHLFCLHRLLLLNCKTRLRAVLTALAACVNTSGTCGITTALQGNRVSPIAQFVEYHPPDVSL